MAWKLTRERDGAGDSGPLIEQYRINPETNKIEQRVPMDIGDVLVGWAVRVGSPYARSFQSQDYWTTTPITEILERGKRDVGEHTYHWIKFKTGNSVYTLED